MRGCSWEHAWFRALFKRPITAWVCSHDGCIFRSPWAVSSQLRSRVSPLQQMFTDFKTSGGACDSCPFLSIMDLISFLSLLSLMSCLTPSRRESFQFGGSNSSTTVAAGSIPRKPLEFWCCPGSWSRCWLVECSLCGTLLSMYLEICILCWSLIYFKKNLQT